MSVQIVANVLAPSEFNPLPSFAPPLKAKVLPPKLWVMCESANFTRCHTICEISFAPSNEWRTKPRIANGLKVIFCVWMELELGLKLSRHLVEN